MRAVSERHPARHKCFYLDNGCRSELSLTVTSSGRGAAQVLSSDVVNQGAGVYWMFYSGGSFDPVATPPGFPGPPPGSQVEGLQ